MDCLRRVRHLALDLDGTLYLGKRVFPFTAGFLRRVERLGIGRTFFTNNSSVGVRGYVEKLRGMGIEASAGEVYTSGVATLDYLRAAHAGVRRVYVLGTPDLRGEFAAAGYEVVEGGAAEPEVVVVGFDTTLDYGRVCEAAYWVSRGRPFLATNCDAVCPTDRATVLVDCGSVCRMIAHATGREPDAVLGKPARAMLEGAMRRAGVAAAAEVAVVGDRLYTDVAMARAAGAVGVLVLSGETTAAQAGAAGENMRPDLVVRDVGELGALLEEAVAGETGREVGRRWTVA